MHFKNHFNGEDERIKEFTKRNSELLPFNLDNQVLSLNKSASLPSIIQPIMRFKHRDSIERVVDAIDKNSSNMSIKLPAKNQKFTKISQNKKYLQGSNLITTTDKNKRLLSDKNQDKYKKPEILKKNKNKVFSELLNYKSNKKTYFNGITSISYVKQAEKVDPELLNKIYNKNNNYDDNNNSYVETNESKLFNYKIVNLANNKNEDDQNDEFSKTKLNNLKIFLDFQEIQTHRQKLAKYKGYLKYLNGIKLAYKLKKNKTSKFMKNPLKFFEECYYNSISKNNFVIK